MQKDDGIKISAFKPQVTRLLQETLKEISLLKQPLE
jgi:hypothetical protein